MKKMQHEGERSQMLQLLLSITKNQFYEYASHDVDVIQTNLYLP